MLRKEREESHKEVQDLRDQLYAEQRKLEINYKSYNEQLQDMYVKEQEKRDSEVRRERDERKLAEKEYQNKLDELQIKMERLLKETQREYTQEYDSKLQEIINKNSLEVSKFVDQIQKQQIQIQKAELALKEIEQEKHQIEIKMIETKEMAKAEKAKLERN